MYSSSTVKPYSSVIEQAEMQYLYAVLDNSCMVGLYKTLLGLNLLHTSIQISLQLWTISDSRTFWTMPQMALLGWQDTNTAV